MEQARAEALQESSGVAALAISPLGPMGATTSIGMVALASVHVVAGVVVLAGERRARHHGVA